MTEKLRLLELLEEAMDSDLTPEELCAQDPHLIPELRRRLEQCRVVRDELNALFPSETLPFKQTAESLNDSLTSLPAVAGYEVDSVLGRGGMGVVYKARHLALKRLVAIKMLIAGIHGAPGERARIRREAEALAKLTHPHIVQVYDVGELDAQPYFTMEFMAGGSLDESLAGAPQPAAYAVSTLIDLAQAVEAAHKCGIVHRDLKPANVLLTVDGVTKISDFGLARQVEDASLLTLPGARMGTPSYMAPEQASKRWGQVGPSSDVYSLGAILYEMLTGRPPFRGESPADTERQLLNEEVVPPSRLNTRVPRDLETICLKCLQKDPGRRYPSARELAEDLVRFQRREPIAARRVGRVERTLKWVRRRPAATMAILSAALLALVLAAAATWVVSQRSASRRALASDLDEVVAFQRKSAWRDASLSLDRAALRLGPQLPDDLRARYDQARRDSDLAARLDSIRNTGEVIKAQRVDPDYGDAFRSAQFGGPDDPPQVVAARIRDSNVRYALIDALDDWVSFSYKHRTWLLEVARRADHDPTGWRDHVRDPAVWENRLALAKAGDTAPFADQPVPFLYSMATQLKGFGLTALSTTMFLSRIQETHPGDFWINFTLGSQFRDQKNYPEAIRYLQTATAIRPDAAIVRIYLGYALLDAGRTDDALTQLSETLRIDPASAMAKEVKGGLLSRARRDAEAIPLLEDVVRNDPANPRLNQIYDWLGTSLLRVGREDEALDAFRQAIQHGASSSALRQTLQGILIRRGHWDQIESIWQDAIQKDPSSHVSWDGYAEYCAFAGKAEDYRRVRKAILDHFADNQDASVCEAIGRASLLINDDQQELKRAVAAVDRAVNGPSPKSRQYHDYYVIAQGLADYRLGNFETALKDVKGGAATVLRPVPQLVAAMSQYRLGQQQAARKLLVDSVLMFDWSREKATNHEAWIFHVLRREAEQLILPNLKDLIDGSAQPRDNDERLALLGICTFEDLRGRRAQLWLDAVDTVPASDNFRLEDAARAAATAGLGQGKDAAKYSDEDRTRWRQSALSILSKRIDFLENILNSASPPKAAIQTALQKLQQSPDLAGLREPEAVARLPKSEQDLCAALWSRIRTVLERANPGK